MPKIWTEHPVLGPDVEGELAPVSRRRLGAKLTVPLVFAAAMTSLLCDHDEKVRIAACTAFQGLDYETTSTHASETVLRVLGERCMDTKVRFNIQPLLPKPSLIPFYSLLYALSPSTRSGICTNSRSRRCEPPTSAPSRAPLLTTAYGQRGPGGTRHFALCMDPWSLCRMHEASPVGFRAPTNLVVDAWLNHPFPQGLRSRTRFTRKFSSTFSRRRRRTTRRPNGSIDSSSSCSTLTVLMPPAS